MTERDIRNEARDLVLNAIDEGTIGGDDGMDPFDWAHETVDGHEWVIYYYGNDYIIHHTANPDAYQDIYSNEDMGQLVVDQGIEAAHTAIAFWAMYQDVSDLISDKLDELEDK